MSRGGGSEITLASSNSNLPNRRVERRDTLDKMIASKTLSEAGANWVRKALDPYHDFQVRVDGLPDENVSRVVIQEVTLSANITAPTGIGASTWDCHIFTLPELQNIWNQSQGSNGCLNSYLKPGNLSTNNVAAFQPSLNSTGFNLGLCNIVSTLAGGPTSSNGANMATPSSITSLDFSAFFPGQKRLIALAFEVHDTTSTLHQQGAVTVYRMPQCIDDTQVLLQETQTGVVNAPILTKVSRLPPATISEAMLLTGAAQWEAKEGAYCVAVMDPQRNDLSGSMWAHRLFTRGDLGANFEGLNTGTQYATSSNPTINQVGTTAIGYASTDMIKPTPFHSSGAYFTGLDPAATLTLTCRAIFESAPTPENTQLVVLAKPSPDYDPVAIDLYKAAAARLPVGVPVSQNASGDFWDGVLGVISDVAPLVGGLLPIPGAGMIGSLAGGAAKAMKASRAETPAPSSRPQVSGNFSANGNKNAVVVKKKK